jgi:hypothetical protein
MPMSAATKLDHALELAASGYYVFPSMGKDRPLVKSWQSVATTDAETIRAWWTQWPHALACIVPGLSGHTVIDIDVHPDQPSGFDSALLAGAPLTAEVSNISMSGNGLHLWYLGTNRTGQRVNGMEAIDSRSVGGYVVTHDDYELPAASAVTEPLPAKYRVALPPLGLSTSTGATVTEWREMMDAGAASPAVESAATAVTAHGMSHDEMLTAVGQLVGKARTTGDLAVINEARSRYALGYDPRYVRAWDDALRGSVDTFGFPPTVASARRDFGIVSSAAAQPAATGTATVTALRSSWDDTPFDAILDQIAAGTLVLPTPTVGIITGTDLGLFYEGRVNGLAGESGSGKGWIAFATAVEQMKLGRDFYYLDFEDSPALAMLRLINGLGTDPALLKGRMHYIHPREHTLAEIAAFVERVRATPNALVVIDSTGESIGQSGRAQNIDEEVAGWFQELPHPLSEAGATVVLIDHLVKSPEGGLWPSGSQRKRAAITGTQLIVEVVDAPSTDDDGMVILKVAKDRHGARSAGSAASFVKFTHNPFTGTLIVTFDPGKTAEQLKLERATKAATAAAAQLDADVIELGRMAPRPASVRDVKDRSGWGTARASDALREYRSRGL